MKTFLFSAFLFSALSAAAWADPTMVYQPVSLPPGPVLAPPADFAAWEIDFSYGPAADDAKTSAPAATTPAVPSNSQGRPRRLMVMRTKPLWHAVLVDTSGRSIESWFDGANRYVVDPAQPKPVAVMPRYGFLYPLLDQTGNHFPDLAWLSAETCLGLQKGTTNWVFQRSDGTLAWVDSNTRRPVQWKQGDETRTFTYPEPPSSPLALPPEVARLSEGLKRLQSLSDQIPAHR